MGVAITERPYRCSWSKNDIRWVFNMNLAGLQNPQLQVKLQWSPVAITGAITWQDLTPFLLKPDAAGNVYLYVQDYIDSLLEYVLPDTTTGVYATNADQQACMITITYRQLSDNVDTPDYDLTEQANNTTNYKLYVIKGGIEKWKHSRNNYFLYFNTSKPYLTWQPGDRMIDKNETIFLTFLNPKYTQVNASDSYQLRLAYKDLSGAVDFITIPLLGNCLLMHLMLPVNTLPLTLYNSNLYLMTVTVLNSNSESVANTAFYFEYRPLFTYYDLCFHNSLGGVDFIRVKGEVNESVDRVTEDADAGREIDGWNRAVKGSEAIYSNILLNRKFKGDVGYLRDKNQQYALTELLASKSIYMRIGWRWVPVLNLQKSAEWGAKRSSINSFPIEWGLSESNEVFTPFDFNLSPGNLT